jgi:hypothetical protein
VLGLTLTGIFAWPHGARQAKTVLKSLKLFYKEWLSLLARNSSAISIARFTLVSYRRHLVELVSDRGDHLICGCQETGDGPV